MEGLERREEVALLLFPAEVWELILGNLEHSLDILSVYKAYPELERERVLKNKRHLWLFEQAVPHVIPWLPSKALLNSRQVCWRWSRGIDNFLENHPAKRAYSHEGHHDLLIRGQEQWFPETSPRHYMLESHFPGWTPIVRMGTLSKLIVRFPTPPERNPIVGRTITFVSPFFLGGQDMDEFWKGVVELLKVLGGHIWCIHITLRYFKGTAKISRLLLDMLANLPNLKSLQIAHYRGDEDDEDEDDKKEALRMYLPPLPCLETLVIQSFPRSLVDMLILRYSKQLQKLEMDHRYWKPEHSGLLQNLTELKMAEWDHWAEVEFTDCDFLINLHSLKLYKLEFPLTRAGDISSYMDRVVPLLELG